MALVEQAASRGVDWENLLIETLTLLHRIAMLQLLPNALDSHYISVEQRLRELARTLPPSDLQLFYQVLLTGRKELTYAPDRRMGVEMTLLRALAFHPKEVIAEPVAAPQTALPSMPVHSTASAAPSSYMPTQHSAPDMQGMPPAGQFQPQEAAPVRSTAKPTGLSDATAQLLQARSQLRQKTGGGTDPKKNEPAAPVTARPASSALERLASVTERSQQRQAAAAETKPLKKEAYRWKAQTKAVETKREEIATPKALRTALEYEKTPELAAKLAEESLTRDEWAAELNQLRLPKLVQQLALNAFREPAEEGKVLLHLRSSQRHLNSASAQQTLSQALSEHYGRPVELTIIEDDNPERLTPLEWRQTIYEEKLAQARQSIAADSNIQTLRRFFDAELDEESIRPV